MRILLVENNTRALKKLTRHIRGPCINDEIICFTDPLLAMRYGMEHHVDVIFTEIRMDKMSGFYLAKSFREVNPKIFVVFTTDKPDYALDAFGVHADGYLMKPVTRQAVDGVLLYARQNMLQNPLRKKEDRLPGKNLNSTR